MIRILFIFWVLFYVSGFGQNNTPTYTWRMHLPYNSVYHVEEVEGKLFVQGEVGIYTFDLTSGEVETLTKVDGFSESEVACLDYSKEYKTVVVVYSSGNIDLIKGNTIINLPGISRSSIVGLKNMNEVKIYDHLAYISTSFGVVVVDIDREEIIDDYQNLGEGGASLEISSVCLFKGNLYLGTSEGLKYAPANDPNVNLKNFSSWSTNLQYDSSYLLQNFDDKMYFVNDSLLFQFDGVTYSLADGGVKYAYNSLDSVYEELIVCRTEGIATINKNEAITELNNPFMKYATKDFEGNLWFGGFYRGLIKLNNSNQYSYLTPPGPFDVNSYDMDGVGTQMYVTSGGHTGAFGPTFNDRGYFVYEDGNWRNSEKDDPIAQDNVDLTNLFISKNQQDIWIGSFGTGLLHLQNGKGVAVYNESNSLIKPAPGGSDVAFGMSEDSKGNLWVANYETDRPLVVRRPDGSWEDFSVGTKRLGEMIVDESDQVWSLAPRTSSIGIHVFKENENGGIERRQLGTTKLQGNLPNNTVNALALDKDNQIWIGTESGIAVFYNPSLVFDDTRRDISDAQQIIIDDGNDVGFLLGNEVVNDIKVDGANRKWIATNNGAWLIEEDGSEVITHFTINNSPLPCNEVVCVGIVPKTGEVFFGTTCGIASFRGDATEANDLHSNTLVFPNPVHPDYDGPVTINGLPQNATVKIADVAGRVVYEMVADGGTATWDGRNFNGERPATGIYLIFTANEDDEDSLVSKLLIVR